MPKKDRRERINEILQDFTIEEIEQYNETEVARLKGEKREENIKNAVSVCAEAHKEYNKINGFFRFFSHFVPNSWTKTGQLRQEIEDLDKSFEKNGYSNKEITDYYRKNWGEDLFKAQLKTEAENNSFTTRGLEKALRKIALENFIAPSIDISDKIYDEEKIDDDSPEYDGDDEELEDEDEKESLDIEDPNKYEYVQSIGENVEHLNLENAPTLDEVQNQNPEEEKLDGEDELIDIDLQ